MSTRDITYLDELIASMTRQFGQGVKPLVTTDPNPMKRKHQLAARQQDLDNMAVQIRLMGGRVKPEFDR